ncbi:hypothetical protein CYMTET_9730 [Cymbomonas tetramitiformis]|uniref:Right handed beta helix domain-containing protein n=1 Tax=Cymbomonas tetramitiformis TaxID=36881 RepID=A0AAE0GR28_9CHLO|nr:hypothetical protein CYMTET_9730 [Cymbomonas tetramitiformis]
MQTGSLSVQESSLFTGNQAESSGGAIYDRGSGIYMIGTGVEISGNACGSRGGAIYVHVLSTAEIGPGSVFTNNSASLDGGAISVYTSSDLTVVSSIFTFNTALRKGGAIIGEDATTSIDMFNTTLSGNMALEDAGGGVFTKGTLVLEGCTLHGNSAYTTGGGCYTTSSLVLRNTTVQENVAGTEGGGVSCAPTAEIVLDNATIVTSNFAALVGGGIYLGSQGAMLVQGRTMIFNNSAQLSGGGLFVGANASILVTDQSEVTSNSAVMGNGGGILGDLGSLIQVTGKVTVGSNVAGNSGGGMAYSTLRLLQSDVQGNVAMNLGGGIYGSSSAEVLNATIGSNTAAQGGGVYIKPVAESLTRPPFQLQEASIVENNEATAGEAGGIYVAYGVSLVVNRSHINGNKASSDAGGIFCEEASEVTLEQTIIDHNLGLYDGGGMSLMPKSKVLMTESLIGSNYANGNGGGLVIGESSAAVLTKQCRVENNRCGTTGGGIYTTGQSQITIDEGGRVAGNLARKEGGGISLNRGNDSMLALTDTTVSMNSATQYSGGGIISEPGSNMVLHNVTITYNAAGYRGGGIMATRAIVELRGNGVMEGNLAQIGGAICLEATQFLMLSGYLLYNRATLDGGAVAAFHASFLVLGNLTNSTNPDPDEGAAGEQSCLMQSGSTHGHQQGLDHGFAVIAEENVATVGAVLYVQDSTCLLDSAWFVANRVVSEGVMFLAGSVAHMSRTCIIANRAGCPNPDSTQCAKEQIAVVHLSTGSQLQVVHVGFVDNLVRGIHLAEASTIRVMSSTFSNTSDAAMHLLAGTSGTISECVFVDNVGHTEAGGAIHSSGSLNVTSSIFEGNTAKHGGGAMWLGKMAASGPVRIDSCNFTSNRAAAGQSAINGGVFVIEEVDYSGNGSGWIFEFTALRFEGNTATGGGAVGFWAPLNLRENPSAPVCDGCVLVNDSNMAGYSSPDGWASRAVSLHLDQTQPEITGGYKMAMSLSARVVDIYGEVVTSDSSSVVHIEFDDPRNRCGQTSGPQSVTVKNGLAEWTNTSGLIISGEAGTDCHVIFSVAMLEDHIMSNTTVVPLRSCVIGEQLSTFDADNYTNEVCEECPYGSISFQNESACTVCEEELDDDVRSAIACQGGDRYVICQGYYLPPNAQYCKDDVLCLLNRLKECEVPEACTTDNKDGSDTCTADENHASRYGAGSAAVADIQLCKAGYGVGMVMCASNIPIGCEKGYYTTISQTKCEQCPPVTANMVQAGMVLAGLFVLMFMVGVFVMRQMKKSGFYNTFDLDDESDEVIEVHTAASLLLGYIQVLGHVAIAYDNSALPIVFDYMHSVMSLVRLDIGIVANLSCVWYHLFDLKLRFWSTFWQSVAAPWLILLFVVVMYEMSRAFVVNDAKSRKKARNKVANMSLFALMYIHPGVATTIFQLFNCHHLHFDLKSLERQSWLALDYSVECFTTSWYIALGFAVLSLITFVFGFPLIILVLMRNLQSYKKVTMPRATAEHFMGLVRCRWWMPVADVDKALLLGGSSFYTKNNPMDLERQQDIDRVASWITMYVKASTFAELREEEESEEDEESEEEEQSEEEQSEEEQSEDEQSEDEQSEDEEDEEEKSKAVEKEKRTEEEKEEKEDEKSTEEEKAMSPEEEKAMSPEEEKAMSMEEKKAMSMEEKKERKFAEKSVLIERRNRKEKYKAKSKEEEMVKSAAAKKKKAMLWAKLDEVMIDRTRVTEVKVYTATGKLSRMEEWVLHEKMDVGDKGISVAVPITRLHEGEGSKVLGQFHEPYEDAFYFWEAYEITRRLMATGLVIVVKLIFDSEAAAIIYGILVSVMGIVMHQTYSPFKSDILDKLQMMILLQLFGTQMTVVAVALSPESRQAAGSVFMLSQFIFVVHIVALMKHTIRPYFQMIKQQFQETKQHVLASKSNRQQKLAGSATRSAARDTFVGENPIFQEVDEETTVEKTEALWKISEGDETSRTSEMDDDGWVEFLANLSPPPSSRQMNVTAVTYG